MAPVSAFQRVSERCKEVGEQELAALALPADSPEGKDEAGSKEEVAAAFAECCLRAFSSSSMRFLWQSLILCPERLQWSHFFCFFDKSVVDDAPFPLVKEAGFWDVPEAACADSELECSIARD